MIDRNLGGKEKQKTAVSVMSVNNQHRCPILHRVTEGIVDRPLSLSVLK